MDKQIHKILFLVTLSQIGGAQKYVVDLARALSAEMKVVVAAGGEPEGWLFNEISTFRRFDVSTYHLPNLVRSTGFVREFLTLFAIIKIIRKEKPDVLHLNSTKIGGLGGFAGILTRTPSVYTVHGLALNDPWPRYLKIFYWFLEKIAFFCNDLIITVSHFDEQSILNYRLAPKKKIRTIHNALPPESVQFLPREEARKKIFKIIQSNREKKAYELTSLRAYQPLIGSIAGHFPPKDIATFIDAAKIVAEQIPEPIFFNIGSGPETKKLELRITNYELRNRFFLLGPVANAQELLLGFDLFVLSSVKEGLPYTLLETAAANIPVITTDVGGIPEMNHGNNWTLIPPLQSSVLAKAITQRVREPNENEPAKDPVEIERLFQQFLEETKKIYHSVVGNERVPAGYPLDPK